MEWSKLKNIIILILLLANGFLLVMSGAQQRRTARFQEQALTDTLLLLERSGITLEQDSLPSELELVPMTIERDQESEAALAAALLGECSFTDLGSGRCAYQSAQGSAEFRSNGSFSFTFPDGVQRAEAPGGEEDHALAVLEQIDFTGVLVSREEEDGQITLNLRQTWQGLPVFSCQAALEYEDGCLRSIAGQRLMGTPQPAVERSEPISVPTALLRVLNGLNGLGDICSEITAMTPAYLLASSADATRLIPAWYVTTDTGSYTLNALTGILDRV